jgi:hypothetical protein
MDRNGRDQRYARLFDAPCDLSSRYENEIFVAPDRARLT